MTMQNIAVTGNIVEVQKTIYKYVKSFWKPGSVLDSNKRAADNCVLYPFKKMNK
jgi:hypothetical protein